MGSGRRGGGIGSGALDGAARFCLYALLAFGEADEERDAERERTMTGFRPTLAQRGGAVAARGLRAAVLPVPDRSILAFVPMAFSDVAVLHYPIEHFSLRWFRALFASADWSRALLNSVAVAIGTTLLALSIGIPAAIGLWRWRSGGKDALMVLIVTPMIVPSVIGATSMRIG
jgi:ABC-type glycerol-3-phosphate transport system permease component